MGQMWSTGEVCDLSEEYIEEIHMITSLPPKEIHGIRRKYKTLVKGEDMTKDEFYALPAISVNPLRDQLFKSLELSPTQTISFAEFAKFVHIFSYNSTQDAKLKEAFKIHDFDGDGKISRDDLRTYCSLVFPKIPESEGNDTIKAQQEILETLIEHVMSEASSAPSRDFLNYDDFVKASECSVAGMSAIVDHFNRRTSKVALGGDKKELVTFEYSVRGALMWTQLDANDAWSPTFGVIILASYVRNKGVLEGLDTSCVDEMLVFNWTVLVGTRHLSTDDVYTTVPSTRIALVFSKDGDDDKACCRRALFDDRGKRSVLGTIAASWPNQQHVCEDPASSCKGQRVLRWRCFAIAASS